MSRKTRSKGGTAGRESPNWRTGDGYPQHGERTDKWAWEFLRRNPEYVADWRQFLAVVDAICPDYAKPCSGQIGEWEAQEKGPYWLISRAYRDRDPRATICDPPRLDGEAEFDWLARVGEGSYCPLDRWLGARWGIESIADPVLPLSELQFRWVPAPFSLSNPGAHRYNNEFMWVDALIRLADILAPEPLSASALQDARTLLAKVPAAWSKRRTEMSGSEPEKHGRFVIEFDLHMPIDEQVRHARDWLIDEQEGWKEGGGEVLGAGRRNKETPGYGTYVRVLDAIAEFGDDEPGGVVRAIAAAMIPGYTATAKYDDNKAHLSRAATWVKRAKMLRDGGYRQLVAMAVKPTCREFRKAKRRKK